MNWLKIFRGSFEQSVDLLYKDDFDYDLDAYAKKETLTHTRRKTVLLTCVMFFLFQLFELLSAYAGTDPDGATLPPATINAIPPFTAFIGGVIWLFGNVIYDWGGFDDMKGNKGTVWLSSCTMYTGILGYLCCLTMISGTGYFAITVYGVFPMWVILSVPVFLSKKRSMVTTLFGLKNERNILDKVMNKGLKFILQFGAAILGMYHILNFSSGGELGTMNLGLGVDLMIFLVILVILISETIVGVYFLFPAIIRSYYRKKYSEELRKLDGKTQIKWYGEKYFLKQIKGTEREERDV